MARFTIGGAGISGLTAAINLTKYGHEVIVHDISPSIGLRPITYQGFMRSEKHRTPDQIKEYLKKCNIKLDFNHRIIAKQELVLDNGRSLKIEDKVSGIIVQRGGTKSIEYSLYKQARSAGVKFQFNSDANKKPMNIIATGTSRTDSIAAGAVYEAANFPQNTSLMMFDDRFSPKGWYSYIIPHGKNRIEVMNCVSRQWAPQVKILYEKLVSQHPRFREILGGAKKIYDVGGRGNFYIPHSAIRGGTLFTGEAAGFQDPFMGFGMLFAIRSGFLAARSLAEGLNYDLLWKSELLPEMKTGCAFRFFTSTFGSRIITKVMNHGLDNQVWKTNPNQVFKNPLLIEFFSALYLLKSRNKYH